VRPTNRAKPSLTKFRAEDLRSEALKAQLAEHQLRDASGFGHAERTLEGETGDALHWRATSGLAAADVRAPADSGGR